MKRRSLWLLAVFAWPWLCGAAAQAEWPNTPANDGIYTPVPGVGLPPLVKPPHPHHGGPAGRGGALLVDCSGSHRGMFHSVNKAARHARPGATILILPPGQGGATCREQVDIRKPLTIASYGGGRDAVIQAPAGGSCLTADIALGDALVLDGLHFYARNTKAPCLDIRAGQVVVRNSRIDSRSTDWAIEARDSVELTVADSHIETDNSGIHAFRAHIALSNVDVDLEIGNIDSRREPEKIGLLLEKADGSVAGGSIIGGITAIRASSGNRDLRLSDITIRKPVIGVAIGTGRLGTVFVNRLAIDQSRDAIVIEPHTDADVTDNVVTAVREAGITAKEHAKTRIDGNTITTVGEGVCIVGRHAGGNLCHDNGPKPDARPNLLERILTFVFGVAVGAAF